MIPFSSNLKKKNYNKEHGLFPPIKRNIQCNDISNEFLLTFVFEIE